jgi:glutathione synthase/RimK-type ligase-like ATP-grasp enzyme
MTKRIGLMVGREWSFPPAFIDEVNRRATGLAAELVQVGGVAMDQPCPWDVIVDRISHEVPFYRTYLKQCVLEGTAVVNNPFMWTADDKFFGAALVTRLGVTSPKTVALPNKDYIPGIVPSESLRNLQYPLDWEGLVRRIGLPCILKDAHGGGWRDVYICHTLEDLIRSYDQSGQLVMIMQEFIHFEQFVRCMCVGQHDILIMPWDPKQRRYGEDPHYLKPALRERVIRDARTIVRALGYDMNTIEFAVRDGVPYAIDFMQPAPDMDI